MKRGPRWSNAQPRRGSSLSRTNIRSGQTCTLSVAQCAEYDRLQRELLGVLEVLCKLAAAQPEAFSAGDAGAVDNTDASPFRRQFRVVGFALVLRPTMGRGGFSIIPPRRIAGALHALQFGMTARHAWFGSISVQLVVFAARNRIPSPKCRSNGVAIRCPDLMDHHPYT